MLEQPTVHIALLMLDLHIPESQSLKSKRKVIKSLKDKIRSKFNVSLAELGDLDKWQRVVIGATMISNDRKHLDHSINALLAFVESAADLSVVDSQIEFI